MAQILIEDLDPGLIERLEALARTHGRTLSAELKHILETAAPAPAPDLPDNVEATIKMAEKMREQMARHAGCDPAQLPPLDRERAAAALERLKALRKTISPGGISIREMREEGRRF